MLFRLFVTTRCAGMSLYGAATVDSTTLASSTLQGLFIKFPETVRSSLFQYYSLRPHFIIIGLINR